MKNKIIIAIICLILLSSFANAKYDFDPDDPEYYGSEISDMSTYPFSTFTDWENLNWDNPSTYENPDFIKNVPADQYSNLDFSQISSEYANDLDFENIEPQYLEEMSTETFDSVTSDNFATFLKSNFIAENAGETEETWEWYPEIVERFDSEVAADPMYINDDDDLKIVWFSHYDSVCLDCSIKSFDTETREIITADTSDVGEEGLAAQGVVRLNIEEFPHAIIKDDGTIDLLQGGTIEIGTVEYVYADEDRVITLTEIDGNSPIISIPQEELLSEIFLVEPNGEVYVGDTHIISKGTTFEIHPTEEDGVEVFGYSGGELTAEFMNPDNHDNNVFISGESPTFIIKGDQVTAVSGHSSLRFTDSTKKDLKLYMEAAGEVSFDLNDINLKDVRYGRIDVTYSILDKITLDDDTRLIDYLTGNDIYVEKETDYRLAEDSCLDEINCIEYYFHEQRAGVMTVNIGDNNDIDINHIMLDVDKGISHLTVNEITDESKLTLTETDSRYIFTSALVKGQGNFATSTIDVVEIKPTEARTEEIHTLTIANGDIHICSECAHVGKFVSESESIILTPQEQAERNFILFTRIANDERYGAEYGAIGKHIVPFPVSYMEGGETISKNRLPVGSSATTFYSYTGGEQEWGYDCTSSVCAVVAKTTGKDKYRVSIDRPIQDLCSNHGWECKYYSLGTEEKFETIEELSLPPVVIENNYPVEYFPQEISTAVQSRADKIFEEASRGSPALAYNAYGGEVHGFMIGDIIEGEGSTIESHVGMGEITIDTDYGTVGEKGAGFLVAFPPKEEIIVENNNAEESEDIPEA